MGFVRNALIYFVVATTLLVSLALLGGRMKLLGTLLSGSHIDFVSASGNYCNDGAWRSVVIVVRDDAGKGAMQLFCRDNGLTDAIIRVATPEELAKHDAEVW